MPGLAESLLPAELKELRYAFPAQYIDSLITSIRNIADIVHRRRDRAACWEQELKRLGEALVVPDINPVFPWRVIRRAPRNRDRLVDGLRANGFDAGTNFPPLADSYPNLLADQRHSDAEQWGSEVINLWVSDDYDDDRIRRAVAVMEQCYD
jgi:dTDP-4-amino-4,6-dideoxygalactose transaminase